MRRLRLARRRQNVRAPFGRDLPQRLARQFLFKFVWLHFAEADFNAERRRTQRFAETIWPAILCASPRSLRLCVEKNLSLVSVAFIKLFDLVIQLTQPPAQFV